MKDHVIITVPMYLRICKTEEDGSLREHPTKRK